MHEDSLTNQDLLESELHALLTKANKVLSTVHSKAIQILLGSYPDWIDSDRMWICCIHTAITFTCKLKEIRLGGYRSRVPLKSMHN